MEKNLKSLKVNELRNILQKAGLSIPAKTNKADLIARIIASPAAVDVYNAQNSPEPQNDDLLAPPEEVDWNAEDVSAVPAKETEQPTAPSQPADPPASQPDQAEKPSDPPAAPPTTSEDPELEKRRKRAERFGIPLVEPKQNPQKKTNPKTTKTVNEDPDKLKSRAERFGASVGTDTLKRKQSEEVVDSDEQEKRRKRAERFGLKT
ncbi:hypothetical protein D9758_002069 [Tetrapyrgos nigripes]|uniref:SAP domain-containing protein n=1 Tax=Tetrapyrgos nigripes TaxID=182062 RepID=A0A8H5LVI0_9AGAR|nr:hypothetical protein D9758_002069 [Tetrapyrgos nigripes]